MTDNQNLPVLRSRQRPAEAPAGSPDAGAALDVELRRANAIAAATAALPPAYRNSPGAVLLADQWARARGIDTLTAIQNVAFVNGRPVVDATFQRALAKRAGFDVRIVETSDEQATVAVEQNGTELGRVTWTMADARRAKLETKDNWRQYPRNMLIARATADALRWYAAEVFTGVYLDDELGSDPVDQMRPAAQFVDVPADFADDEPPIIEAAEVVAETPEPAVLFDDQTKTGWTAENLKTALRDAGISQAQALREASGFERGMATLAALAERPDIVDRILFTEPNPLTPFEPDTDTDESPF